MAFPTAFAAYRLLGTLTTGQTAQAYLACLPEKPEQAYILNAVQLSPQTTQLFQALFAYYESPERSADMVFFFSEQDWFYALFRYEKAPSVAARYGNDAAEDSAEKRFALLRQILLAAQDLAELPLPFLLGALRPEHACFGKQRIRLLCAVDDACLIQAQQPLAAMQQVELLIQSMLTWELIEKKDTGLTVVAGKCHNGLYTSFAQVAYALEQAEESYGSSGFVPSLQLWLTRHSKWLYFGQRMAVLAVVVAVIIFLSLSLFPDQNSDDDKAPLLTIGQVVYQADDTLGGEVEAVSGTVTQEVPVSLSVDLIDGEILFEDHVVRSGETLQTLCTDIYGAVEYASAVAQFNGLSEEEALAAGTILKLPDKSCFIGTTAEAERRGA